MQYSVSKENATADDFGRDTDYYHQKARVQKQVADRLISSLQPWREILPPGPIIELGCGTGFVSQELARLFPERALIFTDQSPEMLLACRGNTQNAARARYQRLDATDIPVDEPTYSMSISSFVAQWFPQPAYTLGRWLEATKAGGLLLAAFPGNQSFPEWRECAEELGLPFTANALPDTEEMVVKLSSNITEVDYYEDTVHEEFDSARDFFHHIKKLGAGRQRKGRHLTTREAKLLCDHWDDKHHDKITVSWHIIFLAVKKNQVD